jgi:transposase
VLDYWPSQSHPASWPKGHGHDSAAGSRRGRVVEAEADTPPVSAFSPKRQPDGWKRTRTLHFLSDADGFERLQRHLDRHSLEPADFLILLEPTGGYYSYTLVLYLLGKRYSVLQVDNRTVKEYREKVYGSETKTDDADARLMARPSSPARPPCRRRGG